MTERYPWYDLVEGDELGQVLQKLGAAGTRIPE